MFFIILLRVIIALDLLLNRRRKIHIVPSGFSVKGSMMCLTQSLWYIYFKFNIFLIFCTLAFLILLYQYTCKEFPSLDYKKVKLPKKSTTVKAFWYCDWQLWIGLFHTGFSVIIRSFDEETHIKVYPRYLTNTMKTKLIK